MHQKRNVALPLAKATEDAVQQHWLAKGFQSEWVDGALRLTPVAYANPVVQQPPENPPVKSIRGEHRSSSSDPSHKDTDADKRAPGPRSREEEAVMCPAGHLMTSMVGPLSVKGPHHCEYECDCCGFDIMWKSPCLICIDCDFVRCGTCAVNATGGREKWSRRLRDKGVKT